MLDLALLRHDNVQFVFAMAITKPKGARPIHLRHPFHGQ